MKWFDPISQRMRNMPEPKKPVEIVEIPEDAFAAGMRLAHERRVWAAVVATATSTQVASQPADEEWSHMEVT